MSLLASLASTPYIFSSNIADQINRQVAKLAILSVQKKSIMSDLKLQNMQMQQYGNQKHFMLAGSTEGIAGANLQKRVNEVVKLHNGNARSFQIQSPEKEDRLTRISMNISLKANIVSLQKILHDLETGAPFVFIEDIVIQAPDNNSGTGNTFQRKQLDITMKIIGYFSQNKSI